MEERTDQWMRSSYFVPFQFLDFFGYWPFFCSHQAFGGHAALETCLYARFLLDRFCIGYDSASQAGGGTQESKSTAKLYRLSHGTVFLSLRLKSLRASRLK